MKLMLMLFAIMLSLPTKSYVFSFNSNKCIARYLSTPSIRRRVIRRKSSSSFDEVIDSEKDKPFALPPGNFRPKQSLGQNFLSDQNYVRKICNSFEDHSEGGSRVVEIGPGAGALTRVLFAKYPKMTAIEIDQRSVTFLTQKLPGLNIIHKDVLRLDWPELAASKGGRVNVIANLPYNIVSQVLFSMADSHKVFEQAVLTMQLEVAQRIAAQPNTKDYGIPSVVLQLYCRNPKILFKIPPTVFYPVPKVDSALLHLDFRYPHPALKKIDGNHLRKILSASFQQRRKMLRQSLRELLVAESKSGLTLVTDLSEKWATRRPEQLTPLEFIELTTEIYGEVSETDDDLELNLATTTESGKSSDTASTEGVGVSLLVFADEGLGYRTTPVWRNVRL